MNRRGFLGTLAALVGVVVAKVKGAPTVAVVEPPLTATGAMINQASRYVFTRHAVWVLGPDRTYRLWKPKSQQELIAARYGLTLPNTVDTE